MQFLVALAIVCTLGVCSAQINPAAYATQAGQVDADKTKWTPLQCRDGVMGPNDARMGEVGACAAEYGPGKKNPACTYFCQATALGLLSKQSLPTEAIYNSWVLETFPARHHSVGQAWFRDCYQKYGKYIDLNDSECKMAKQFGDCTWAVVPNLTCPK